MFNTLSSSIGYVPRRDPAELGDKLFTQLDKSGQGYIELADLKAAFAKVGATERKNGQGADAAQVFNQMDANGDGKLTRQEMTDGVVNIAKQLESQYNSMRAQGQVKPKQPGDHSSQNKADADLATDLFAALDPNKRGYFEKTDLQAAFDKLDGGSADSAKKTDALFAKLDADSDGKVTSSEFAAQFNGALHRPPEFTKDELSNMVDEIGKVDSKRAAMLSDLVANFSSADADGNGKLSRKEASEFLRAHRPQGVDQPTSEARMVSRMAIQAYSSTTTSISQSVTVSV